MNYQYYHRVFAGVCAVAIITIPTVINAAPNPQTRQAMIDAINDEYNAHAFYTGVIKKFGTVRPFANIVHAEERHIDLWKRLFTQYGLPIPPDTFIGKVNIPESIQSSCQRGVKVEIANVAMYDCFLSFVQQADLRAAFVQLRQVSQERHLKAFELCLNR